MNAPMLTNVLPYTLLRDNQTIQNSSIGASALILKGAVGQTANIFVVQNSAGATLFSVDPVGNLTVAGTASIVINEAVTGNLNLTGNLSVTGTSTLTGAVTMNGGLTVTGSSTFNTIVTVQDLTSLGTIIANNFTVQSLSTSGNITFNAGNAIGNASYQLGRDNSGTNQLFFNVPTGAAMRWAINGTNRMVLDTNGNFIFTQGTASSGVVSFQTFTAAANTGRTALTEVINFNINTSATQTWAAGTVPLQREVVIQAPTYAFVSASTISDAATFVVLSAPVAGNNTTYGGSFAAVFGLSNVNIGPTTASLNYSAILVPTHTITVTGTTQVTSPGSFSAMQLEAIMITDASAVTINSAATLVVTAAPIAAGSVTLTNSYAFWVQAGTSYFQGRTNNSKGANISSTNTMTLGTDGNTFTITGTTTINGIVTTGWSTGAEINLIFSGALTVTHNSGAPGANAVALLLSASANLTTATNTILCLVYDGTNWQEKSRKAA